MTYDNWTSSELLDAYMSISQEIRGMEDLRKGPLEGFFLSQRLFNRLNSLEKELWTELNKRKEVKVLL